MGGMACAYKASLSSKIGGISCRLKMNERQKWGKRKWLVSVRLWVETASHVVYPLPLNHWSL